MLAGCLKLSVAAFLPVIASFVFHILEKKTSFSKLNKVAKQIIIGVAFGGLAIVGTEWGININGAIVNCRDAAVLSAGLLFGGPAGIIAGIIGGVERWFAVAWGAGTYTQIACTVSTILAGFFAAALRKFLFENKKPGWLISLAIGVVVEVFHLTMVFVTHIDEPKTAIDVVMACSIPMIVANGVSTMLAAMGISLFERDNKVKSNKTRISQTIQRWLMVTVSIAFVVSTLFLFQIQSAISKAQTETLLKTTATDVASDISETSDRNLKGITLKIVKEVGSKNLDEIAKEYGVAEINIINSRGIITESTNKDFVGYDMYSGSQSTAFMDELETKASFVQDYGPIAKDKNIKRKYAGAKLRSGFLQVGYDSEQFHKDIQKEVDNIIKNRHIDGDTGYLLVVNEKFEVVATTKDKEFIPDSKGNNSNNYKENEIFNIEVNGEDSYCCFKSVEGYYVIPVYPENEATKLRNIAMSVNSFMEVLIFAILFLVVYLIIKNVVVNKIKDINNSLAKITNGDLDETIDVRSNEEFASLSDDINSTVDTLKHYIDEASARIDKELEFAKNIQSSALPNIFPAFPKRKDFDIYALMETAKEVGGDFYDFYFTRANILNILIADVSGKGIPAAMFMMRAKSELKGLTETDLTLDDVFTKGNDSLCNGNEAGMFVTAWQGRINLETGLVQFANAGHNPPLVKHKNGTFEYLKTRRGLVLAGMDGINYRTQELQLEAGDIIYLYTDGVTEATNSNNELYGEDRLQKILNSREFDDMNELCDTVKKDVDKFVGDAEQFDDITMLAFKYIGDSSAQIHFDEAKIEDIPAVTDFVSEQLEALDCPMKAVVQLNIAIDELYSNISKFAYPESTGPVTVKVQELEEPHAVSVTFIDEGVPYNPLVKDDPDTTLSVEEREIGGLGIFMVKKSMDDMQYRYENEKNILTIIKKI